MLPVNNLNNIDKHRHTHKDKDIFNNLYKNYFNKNFIIIIPLALL